MFWNESLLMRSLQMEVAEPNVLVEASKSSLPKYRHHVLVFHHEQNKTNRLRKSDVGRHYYKLVSLALSI